MVPVDLQVTALSSSDPKVATVSPPTFSPGLTIHLSRRPNKSTARVASVSKQTVGSWQPISTGLAELRAIVNAAPPAVGAGGPTEDVNVL
jgi:hypothetical protein